MRCLEYIKTVNHVIAQSVNYLTALYKWLNPSPRWVFGKIGVAVLLIEFSLLMALAFAYAAKRRLERI